MSHIRIDRGYALPNEQHENYEKLKTDGGIDCTQKRRTLDNSRTEGAHYAGTQRAREEEVDIRVELDQRSWVALG